MYAYVEKELPQLEVSIERESEWWERSIWNKKKVKSKQQQEQQHNGGNVYNGYKG